MRQQFKKFIVETPHYYHVRNWRAKLTAKSRRSAWKSQGCPVPPPEVVKQDTVKSYAKQYKLNVLVETGTCIGDMVQATKRTFERIYSIELSHDLADRAKTRFASDPHVTIIEGDSGAILAELAPKLIAAALFWLDAHYSGGVTARGDVDTPILSELCTILTPKAPRHIILIDDARCFGADAAYPTIEKISHYLKKHAPTYSLRIADDITRIVPDVRIG